jgi:AcrR family transcriptional regulator
VDKKTQLLDAAERVYCEFGNLGLTVRRLAAEGDTTSQTIYTYFGSRDAVIVAMYDRILADLDEMLTRLGGQLGGAGDAKVRLVDTAVAYLSYCAENPARFKMLAEGKGPEGTEPEPVRARQRQLVSLVEGAVAAAGVPLDGWNGNGVRAALALLHGLVQAELNGFVNADDASDSAHWELTARVLGLALTRPSVSV